MENQSSKSDEFRKVRALFLGLVSNLSDGSDISETKVKEYHSYLDRMEKIDTKVTEFRISDTKLFRKEVGPRVIRGSTRLSPEELSEGRYVKYRDFKERTDALLMYLSDTPGNSTGRIGFEKE